MTLEIKKYTPELDGEDLLKYHEVLSSFMEHPGYKILKKLMGSQAYEAFEEAMNPEVPNTTLLFKRGYMYAMEDILFMLEEQKQLSKEMYKEYKERLSAMEDEDGDEA